MNSDTARRLLPVLALLAFAPPGRAVVFASREEALARLFPPPATVERRTHFLTAKQQEEASRRAQTKVDSALVVAYVGKKDGELLGTAFFDTHMVRTMPETICVFVLPDGSVGSVEVLSFGEPEDYLPRPGWLRFFEHRKLDSNLSVGRGLGNVTGATLTTRAIAAAVRRVLAIHAVLTGGGQS
ncbi:MAG TPA: FMN-binding protein [Thermoanaerobaculia bacterium]|nr:FMN-binding protein [Thermoanaerobaculia bacterium]